MHKKRKRKLKKRKKMMKRKSNKMKKIKRKSLKKPKSRKKQKNNDKYILAIILNNVCIINQMVKSNYGYPKCGCRGPFESC